jgi:hypothetical protein
MGTILRSPPPGTTYEVGADLAVVECGECGTVRAEGRHDQGAQAPRRGRLPGLQPVVPAGPPAHGEPAPRLRPREGQRVALLTTSETYLLAAVLAMCERYRIGTDHRLPTAVGGRHATPRLTKSGTGRSSSPRRLPTTGAT